MTRDRDLQRGLRALRAPDEAEAETRAWTVVREAYDQRVPVRPAPRVRRLALIAAGGIAALALGLSPAGAKVGDLVSEVVGIGADDTRPALRSLPAPGELLVESEQGPWIVRADGSKRLLGDYGEASWSPSGIYVAAGSGRELLALETDGDVRWTYPAPGIVRDPRWTGDSTDTRIAYRSGSDLRVIAGDGTPESDRLIARDVAAVAAAWRPAPAAGVASARRPFVLTYVDAAGRPRTVDVERGVAMPTSRSDRRRLAVPTDGSAEDRALAPDGSRVARLEHAGGNDRLIVTDRGGGASTLFSARSRLTGPTWSPDGRWLLIGWPAADQWLFIDADRPRHVVAFDRISAQFAPGAGATARFPRVAGWMLPTG